MLGDGRLLSPFTRETQSVSAPEALKWSHVKKMMALQTSLRWSGTPKLTSDQSHLLQQATHEASTEMARRKDTGGRGILRGMGADWGR